MRRILDEGALASARRARHMVDVGWHRGFPVAFRRAIEAFVRHSRSVHPCLTTYAHVKCVDSFMLTISRERKKKIHEQKQSARL